MKAISFTKQTPFGVDATVWIAKEGRFGLDNDEASLQIVGYATANAFSNGAAAIDQVGERMTLSGLQTFEPMWTEIATKLISEGGTFAGGTIIDI